MAKHMQSLISWCHEMLEKNMGFKSKWRFLFKKLYYFIKKIKKNREEDKIANLHFLGFEPEIYCSLNYFEFCVVHNFC